MTSGAETTLTFVANGSDTLLYELVPGGETIGVTYSNRLMYCRLLEQFRLHEFDQQIGAIRRGLGTIIPLQVLRLYTWQQVEVLVCGQPMIDLEVWMLHTEYQNGYNENHPTIRLFWKVIKSLSSEEQAGFVRFAWGRSRLPSRNAWFDNMKLQRSANSGGKTNVEDMLPVAHTCFFSVELPPYTQEEKMRHGLLTAIHFGAVGVLNG